MRWIQLALWLALLACGAPPPPEGPEGAWWVGERAAAESLLGQLGALEGTSIASWAEARADALPGDCAVVGLHAPEGDWSTGDARCVAPGDRLEAAWTRARTGAGDVGADLAFGRRVEGEGSLRGTVRLEGGDIALAFDWRDAGASGALALLVPGERAAGADRLAAAERLLHARVRPAAGIDLGALTPPGSQGDRLFRLRNELFASAVLDGTWELALYAPERPGALPAAALALGVRSPAAARAAIEGFVAELAEAWSVAPSPITLPAGAGHCLLELALLPELAPCYVADDDVLVVAWNPRALERALPPDDATSQRASDAAAARFELDLARMAESDARAAQLARPGLEAVVLDWPWRELSASARRLDGALRVEARLLAPEAS